MDGSIFTRVGLECNEDRAGSGVLKKEVRGQARIDEEELKENVRELKYLGSELHRGN